MTGPGGPERASGLRATLVCAPAAFGGLETVVSGLAAGLSSRGHDIQVGLVGHAPDLLPLAERLRQAGVEVHSLPVRGRRYFLERRLVRKLLERRRPMLLHTHGYRADVIASPVARSMGIPTLSTVHGFTGGGARNRFYETLQVRALRKMDGVVAVSRPLAERLRESGVAGGHVRCIRNAWVPVEPLRREDARARLSLPAQDVVIGWVGRLSREKGPDVLLHALGLLDPAGWLACFVGEGPLSGQLRGMAQGAGVAPRCRWLGTVPEAGRLLRAFDLIVLSSRTEGTPMVLLEAMASGVPVVATTVGGVPDVVSAREAVLVPPEDPGTLAAAIRGVLGDREGAGRRTTAAAERVRDEFGVESWLAAYEQIYREVGPR